MKEIMGRADASGRRIGLVVSRWNELVTGELLRGALDELKALGDPEAVVVHVPGAWEIPLAAQLLIEREDCHAVAALGCILRGQTGHAEQLAGEVGGALMGLQLRTGRPVSWGILTPETQEQAFDRIGLKAGHKGREAARAAVEMSSLVSGS
jgi:6,7-dimethyl-8-ribityllumazine synthase